MARPQTLGSTLTFGDIVFYCIFRQLYMLSSFHLYVVIVKFHFKIPNSFDNIAPAMSGMCIVFNYENIFKKKAELHQHAPSPEKNFNILMFNCCILIEYIFLYNRGRQTPAPGTDVAREVILSGPRVSQN